MLRDNIVRTKPICRPFQLVPFELSEARQRIFLPIFCKTHQKETFFKKPHKIKTSKDHHTNPDQMMEARWAWEGNATNTERTWSIFHPFKDFWGKMIFWVLISAKDEILRGLWIQETWLQRGFRHLHLRSMHFKHGWVWIRNKAMIFGGRFWWTVVV